MLDGVYQYLLRAVKQAIDFDGCVGFDMGLLYKLCGEDQIYPAVEKIADECNCQWYETKLDNGAVTHVYFRPYPTQAEVFDRELRALLKGTK